jgi:AAA family ATP:ADP antiporter
VNTSGEFLLGRFVAEQAVATAGANLEAQRRFVGEFYGDFFTWVNLAGVLLQTFAVSRIFRTIGVRGALFVLPMIALTGATLLMVLPVLGVIRLAKIFENSTDYSLQNTTKQALFLTTSREAKYKAKSALDTFFVRLGDMIQAGIVFAGTTAGLSVAGFAAINVGLILAWLAVAYLLAGQHRHTAPALAEAV